jgi:hypothetical protein
MLPTAREWLRTYKRDSRMPSERPGFPPGIRFGYCQQLGYWILSPVLTVCTWWNPGVWFAVLGQALMPPACIAPHRVSVNRSILSHLCGPWPSTPFFITKMSSFLLQYQSLSGLYHSLILLSFKLILSRDYRRCNS